MKNNFIYFSLSKKTIVFRLPDYYTQQLILQIYQLL